LTQLTQSCSKNLCQKNMSELCSHFYGLVFFCKICICDWLSHKPLWEIFRKWITPMFENWTIKNVHFRNFTNSFFREMERFHFFVKNSKNRPFLKHFIFIIIYGTLRNYLRSLLSIHHFHGIHELFHVGLSNYAKIQGTIARISPKHLSRDCQWTYKNQLFWILVGIHSLHCHYYIQYTNSEKQNGEFRNGLFSRCSVLYRELFLLHFESKKQMDVEWSENGRANESVVGNVSTYASILSYGVRFRNYRCWTVCLRFQMFING